MPHDLEMLAEAVRQGFAERLFDDVCAAFRLSEQIELPPYLLLSKAKAIQLASNTRGYTLDDARKSLVEATKLDPSFAQGWIELGHFYFAVDDDSRAATKCFEAAAPLCARLIRDLMIGHGKALAELGRYSDALIVLSSPQLLGDSEEVRLLRQEVESRAVAAR